MWNDSVVTNAGRELLAQWASGGILNITGATGGTGTIEAVQLAASTALVNEMQRLSIVHKKAVEQGVEFNVQITAAEVAAVYTQIGIWGNLDGGEETLIAIYQDENGINVPSAEEMPDYVYAFFATVQMSNELELNVTIDGNAYVTRAELEAALAGLKNPAMTETYTAVIPAEGWTGDAAPYYIEVTVEGMLADDNPIADIVQTGTESTDSAMRDAWGEITRITTGANSIVVYAGNIPAVAIPIQLKVVR